VDREQAECEKAECEEAAKAAVLFMMERIANEQRFVADYEDEGLEAESDDDVREEVEWPETDAGGVEAGSEVGASTVHSSMVSKCSAEGEPEDDGEQS